MISLNLLSIVRYPYVFSSHVNIGLHLYSETVAENVVVRTDTEERVDDMDDEAVTVIQNITVSENNNEANAEEELVVQFSKRLFGSNLNNRCHGVVSFTLL